MIELFRNWINILLCLGIFTVIVQLIVPKNKMRKYIYSLLGVITVIAIISPVIQVLKNPEMESGIKEVLSNLDQTSNTPDTNTEAAKKAQEEAVKTSFISSVKLDVKNKLKEKAVEVNHVEIFMNANYDIEKIEINIAKLSGTSPNINNVTDVVKYINEQYDIAYERIVVIEEGT